MPTPSHDPEPRMVFQHSHSVAPRIRSARALVLGMDDATALATINKRLEEVEWCINRLRDCSPIPHNEEHEHQMNRLVDLRAGLRAQHEYHTLQLRASLITA